MANIIVRDQEILGGEPVFRGTRVPFQALLDYLEHGKPLQEFLEEFPSVTRDEAIAALEEAKSLVFAQLGVNETTH
jgi:uncharacterized protein (DUF433 family)